MLKRFAGLAFMALALSGCHMVETGNVGVRYNWDKSIKTQEESSGMKFVLTSEIKEFSAREITMDLKDLTPKASDNLLLDDMDVQIYYQVTPDKIADFEVEKATRSAYDRDHGVWYTGWYLVESNARNAVYDSVSKHNSLDMHKEREGLEKEIKLALQAKLDADSPGIFKIGSVLIRNIATDKSIENAIRNAVAKQKELEAKAVELEIADKQVQINNKLAASLPKEILEIRKLEMLEKVCGNGGCVFINGDATPLVNVGHGK